MILMDRTEQLERWDDTENVTKTKRITALQEYSGKYLAAVELNQCQAGSNYGNHADCCAVLGINKTKLHQLVCLCFLNL